MSIDATTRQAYSEVDEFLEMIDDYERYQIPEKLREYFKKEKDPNYYKGLNPNIPIKNQGLKEETLAIIALLNLQYWCDDEEEKERLKKVYADNEDKYYKYMREKYNPDDIFKKNQTEKFEESIKVVEENLPDVATYKEPIWKQVVSKIKKFFNRVKGVINGE